MTAREAQSRAVEHQFLSQLAVLPDPAAAGLRRAMLAAAGRDLVWRQGRAEAAEAFYIEADHLAAGDLRERFDPALPGDGPAFAAKTPQEEAPSPSRGGRSAWLEGFLCGVGCALLAVAAGVLA